MFCVLFLALFQLTIQQAQYEVPEGKIDLTPLANLYYTTEVQTYKGHMVTFTLCQDLDEQHLCVNPTTTHGPAPGKDEYNAIGATGSCWYIGSVDGCFVGAWDSTSKTFRIEYYGVTDPSGQTRSFQFTLHCDPSEKGMGHATCEDVQSQGSTHTFICDIYTEYACPNTEPRRGDCGVCMAFFGSLEPDLKEKEKDIVNDMEKFYCPGTEDPQKCRKSVAEDVPEIIEGLGGKDDLLKICRGLNYCD